ncbi:hypothetical protein EIP91_010990 [Steccherinum ochraceum]|uniref:Uncharacterized protein n=1 Tax=Steccherinum ochraceum TaxID=92696 RepID=A0A4R0RMF4_9APHY|nr:hypothetical protein EIP91_010990 [Steccherinum ochraceum]
MRFTSAFTAFVVAASATALAAPLHLPVSSVHARDDFSSLTVRDATEILNEMEKRGAEEDEAKALREKKRKAEAWQRYKQAQALKPPPTEEEKEAKRKKKAVATSKYRASDKGKKKEGNYKTKYREDNPDKIRAQAVKDMRTYRAKAKAGEGSAGPAPPATPPLESPPGSPPHSPSPAPSTPADAGGPAAHDNEAWYNHLLPLQGVPGAPGDGAMNP